MTCDVQLDLFTREGIEILNAKVEKTSNTSDAVRRGLFARHNRIEKQCHELQKLYEVQQQEIAKLKSIVMGQSPQKIYEFNQVCV